MAQVDAVALSQRLHTRETGLINSSLSQRLHTRETGLINSSIHPSTTGWVRRVQPTYWETVLAHRRYLDRHSLVGVYGLTAVP